MKSQIFVKLPGRSTIHLVESEAEGVPYSHTALCGVSATISKSIPRFVSDGNARVFTGMKRIIFKDVEGWEVSFPPNLVRKKLCERCRKVHNSRIRRAANKLPL